MEYELSGRYPHVMDKAKDELERNFLQEWKDALALSEAQLAAGEVVSGDAVRQRLRESIERMERGADAKVIRR